MKEYSVTLGGKPRNLRFDRAAGKAIERAWMRPDGTPNKIGSLLFNESIEVRDTIIYHGLQAGIPDLQMKDLEQWLWELEQTEEGIQEVWATVIEAVGESGLLGRVFKRFMRPKLPEAEVGKAQETPTTAVAAQ